MYRFSEEIFPDLRKLAAYDDERLMSYEYDQLVQLIRDYDAMAYILNGLEE